MTIEITFIKYCVVGGSGAILNWVLFHFMTRNLGIKDFKKIKLLGKERDIPWAIAIVTGAIVVWNFSWNLVWTFA